MWIVLLIILVLIIILIKTVISNVWLMWGLLILWLVSCIVNTYNKLITKRNKVNNAFASIDVVLHKRHDLIPTLVNVIKGYVKHEKEVLENITEIRTQIMNKSLTIEDKVILENDLSKNLNNILLISENYPKLKSSANFLELQKQLSSIENELAAARRTFNSAVTSYNNTIQVIPTNLLAGIMHFRKMTLLQIKEDTRTNPNVDFESD